MLSGILLWILISQLQLEQSNMYIFDLFKLVFHVHIFIWVHSILRPVILYSQTVVARKKHLQDDTKPLQSYVWVLITLSGFICTITTVLICRICYNKHTGDDV